MQYGSIIRVYYYRYYIPDTHIRQCCPCVSRVCRRQSVETCSLRRDDPDGGGERNNNIADS